MRNAYDIFKEDQNGSPIWLETVIGLDSAKERLAELGAASPGKYLVFNPTLATFVDPSKESAKKH